MQTNPTQNTNEGEALRSSFWGTGAGRGRYGEGPQRLSHETEGSPGVLPGEESGLCLINRIFRVITSLTNCLKTHLVYRMLQWGK